MNLSRTSWLVLCLVFLGVAIVLLLRKPAVQTFSNPHMATAWHAPDLHALPATQEGDLIRYGHDLVANTAYYLGPKGRVAHLSNGMNCQNCHLEAGTKNYGNPFSAVASTYPKYRPRSGRVESIAFRVNDCLVRSLNGSPLDSNSREMKALVAFIKWVGSGVPKGVKPAGSGLEPLPFLTRAADTVKGRQVYVQKCQACHSADGEGLPIADSGSFRFPPLWGKASYNAGAGLYRLVQFAAFVKYNMPFGATFAKPQLSDSEAWDVAAFVNSRPRPQMLFPADWPDLTKKPIDVPFGPYVDSFSQRQHKYGPFAPIAKKAQKQ